MLSMTMLLVVLSAVVFLAGVIVTFRQVANAPVGYQDDMGFHEGRQSASEFDEVVVAHPRSAFVRRPVSAVRKSPEVASGHTSPGFAL